MGGRQTSEVGLKNVERRHVRGLSGEFGVGIDFCLIFWDLACRKCSRLIDGGGDSDISICNLAISLFQGSCR